MKCQIFNYIPKQKSPGVTYEKWASRYFDDLFVMYKILIRNFSDYFDGRSVSWKNYFKKFTLLMYKKSSKYIEKLEDYY